MSNDYRSTFDLIASKFLVEIFEVKISITFFKIVISRERLDESAADL